MIVKIKGSRGLRGEMTVAGDKSISHRAIMCNAIASGKARIRGFLAGEDCLATIDCFRNLGVSIDKEGRDIVVRGAGLHGLKGYSGVLDARNSGTTTRLLTGILQGQRFESVIDGDSSLRKRPMSRIIEPLSLMGGRIEAREGNYAPLKVIGSELRGIDYHTRLASAQVKSCIIFAGLYADGKTTIEEPVKSRDHTENMLAAMGAEVLREGNVVKVSPVDELRAVDVDVAGDVSSAAFFMVAAAVVPDSELTIKNVNLNPTRAGIVSVLKRMGADITTANERGGAEPCADITVRYSRLKAVEVGAEEVPSMIDEFPVLAVAMACADGVSRVSGAGELKVKESDRIEAICDMISSFGGRIEGREDGFVIEGAKELRAAVIDPRGDHRIAMSAAVAALAARGESEIVGAECAAVSFPDFYEILRKAESGRL